jgi:hypothetical protein
MTALAARSGPKLEGRHNAAPPWTLALLSSGRPDEFEENHRSGRQTVRKLLPAQGTA